jgi:hypothetical protein
MGEGRTCPGASICENALRVRVVDDHERLSERRHLLSLRGVAPPGPGRRSSGALPRQSTSVGSLAAVSYICNGEISYSLPGNWEKLRRTAIFCGDLLCDSPTGCDPIVAEQTLPRHTTLARTSAVVRHDMSTVITMTSAAL